MNLPYLGQLGPVGQPPMAVRHLDKWSSSEEKVFYLFFLTRVKGIVDPFFYHIFWRVMGFGIADFGRKVL